MFYWILGFTSCSRTLCVGNLLRIYRTISICLYRIWRSTIDFINTSISGFSNFFIFFTFLLLTVLHLQEILYIPVHICEAPLPGHRTLFSFRLQSFPAIPLFVTSERYRPPQHSMKFVCTITDRNGYCLSIHFHRCKLIFQFHILFNHHLSKLTSPNSSLN